MKFLNFLLFRPMLVLIYFLASPVDPFRFKVKIGFDPTTVDCKLWMFLYFILLHRFIDFSGKILFQNTIWQRLWFDPTGQWFSTCITLGIHIKFCYSLSAIDWAYLYGTGKYFNNLFILFLIFNCKNRMGYLKMSN